MDSFSPGTKLSCNEKTFNRRNRSDFPIESVPCKFSPLGKKKENKRKRRKKVARESTCQYSGT